MKESGYMWPIIEMNLRYIGPATFGQRLCCAPTSSNGKTACASIT
jgi:acyl-CoA thioesterase FadM